ncbi:MAG TPA: hypothetical protein VG369_02020 [Humibacter sp.]|jgi:hypothetical protein|nr:hypothetical protein [Humibacter sp.]
MSDPKRGIQIVAAPASGWCEPDTGVCHIDTVDETTTTEASNEPQRLSPPTR